jgi:hypothetical protein
LVGSSADQFFCARHPVRADAPPTVIDWTKSDIQDTRALVVVDTPVIAPNRVRDAEVEIFTICHGAFCTSLMQRKYRINSISYFSLESLADCGKTRVSPEDGLAQSQFSRLAGF